MEVDWGQALEIGGIGFALVFVVLVSLSLVMWGTNLLLRKYGPKDAEDEDIAGQGEGA